ncbi:TPA: hypothetical protein ACGCB0_004677 [Salmonella enterica subsp. enterica serovar Typhimurium]
MFVFIQVGLGPWPLEEIHNPFQHHASYKALNEKDKREATQIVTTKL